MSDYRGKKILRGKGEVNSTSPLLSAIASPGSDSYVLIEKIIVSVFVAGVGGDGILTVQDTNGEVLIKIPTAKIGVHLIDYGEGGWILVKGTGVDCIVSDSTVSQASCSVNIVGQLRNFID